ncbi:MAG: hypothetical protein HY892_20400 [Deltaproteobacteria bacterium]|nr:hypothetical protein [Deltaproteobacteria bacterium]
MYQGKGQGTGKVVRVQGRIIPEAAAKRKWKKEGSINGFGAQVTKHLVHIEGTDDFFSVFTIGILRIPFQPQAISTLRIGHFDIVT